MLSKGVWSLTAFDKILRKEIHWLKCNPIIESCLSVHNAERQCKPDGHSLFQTPCGIIFWFHSLFTWKSGVTDLDNLALVSILTCAESSGFVCRDYSVTWTPGEKVCTLLIKLYPWTPGFQRISYCLREGGHNIPWYKCIRKNIVGRDWVFSVASPTAS